jgi:hypothetical protein
VGLGLSIHRGQTYVSIPLNPFEPIRLVTA